MKRHIYSCIPALLLSLLLVLFNFNQAVANNLPAPSDFTLSVQNFTQPTDHTIEFDVYLLDNDGAQTFELASVQLGFLLNSEISNSGTITAAINNTNSGLVAAQQFSAAPGIVTPLTGYPGQTLLRLAGRTPPGAGNGTIIATSGFGTLLTHFTLTNSVAWAANTSANLIFTSSTAMLPLYATRISQYISGINTAMVVVPGNNAIVCCNPFLNAAVPVAFNVTGTGSYCENLAGLPVGLSGSETGTTYQLVKDGVPLGSTVPGTGSALAFGIQTTGTYTVTGTNFNGTVPMSGSAVITSSPLPLQPAPFTVFSSVVYKGATGVVYTVPNDPTVTYSWSYSGTGATINGTSNSVNINFSATATSGTLSVTASNGCGTSAARTLAITVNTLSTADYTLSVMNLTQPTDRTIEFDIYLIDNEPSVPFELATMQIGLLLKSNIYTGGTLSAAINNTGSGLLASQQFTAAPSIVTAITGYPGITMLRLAGRTPPGAGNGTIISTTGNGTLITHFTLTSTVAWTTNSVADLIFTSSSVVNPLYATRVSEYIGTTNTALTIIPGTNATVCCNPALNVSLPVAYNVTGSGSYCQGSGGLPVGLSGSEQGVTYTLHGGPLPEPTLPGTGSALDFGVQTAGTYTVSGTNVLGTTPMNGSAVIIENPLLPASITIAADQNNVCAGTLVTFTATPLNGGVNPTISWYVNTVLQGTTGLTFAYTPINGDQVYAVLTADPTLACVTSSPANSNTIAMVVNAPLVVSVSITADQNNVCAGTTVNFTAIPVNGGAAPTISWYVNNVLQGSGLTLSYAPANNDQVYAVLTADPTLTCVTSSPANSNTIAMVVNAPLVVSVSIVADQNNVCTGTTVNFNATPTNGGAAPTISWYVNNVLQGSGLTLSYAPANNDQVYALLTADPSQTCVTGSPATSNTISMVVNAPLAVSVSIAADQNNVCAGTTVNFTATPVNGGAAPTISWYVNNVLQGSGLTLSYAPANNDQVYALLTADPSQTCVTGSPATSNTIAMVVNAPLVVSVSITADQNNVCAGTTVNFTATPANGGASPTISWYVNNVLQGSGLTLSYAPANNDQVYALLTADPTLTCVTGSPATSNAIAMVVNAPLAVSVSIAADQNNVCAGTTVNFTATPANGGAAPTISWYVNNVLQGSGLTLSYAPANNDQVYAVLTADPSLTCVTGSPATSNTIAMVVNAPAVVSVSITADQNNVCAGTTVNFTAIPTNGGAAPTISWYVNNVLQGSGLTLSYAPANNDQVKAVLTADPSLTCVTGSPATSNTIAMVVNAPLAVSVSITASANPVNSGTSVTFTASPVNGGSTPAYQWYVNSVATGTAATYTYTPVNGDQVYVVMTSSALCTTGSPATSNTITMVVNTVLTPTVLTYSGNLSVQYYSTVTVSAQLKDNKNKGVAGKTILFTLGTQSVSAITNTQGKATAQMQVTQNAGSYQMLTSFTGDNTYMPSNDSDPFTVNRKPVTAVLVGTVVKVFDGNAIAYMLPSNYQLNGVITGDNVALNNPATGTYNNPKVGTGKKVTVTGLALTGTAAPNYLLTNTTASANIGTILAAKNDAFVADVIVPETLVTKAYPNPFTESLSIEFTPVADSRAVIDIFDLRGNKVAVIYDATVTGGVTYKAVYIPDGIGYQMLIYRIMLDGQATYGKVIFAHQ